jgi:PAS domain S-box-containing protein
MTDSVPQKLLTAPMLTKEAERLAALHRYKILDTSPEAAFDRITRLAARLFDMPTALISLVDESRAWFKSCIGFGANEVPRDATLCSFAMLIDEPLIVPDARLDARFACNPFVQAEPGVRFYAGAPLLSHDGFNLGTLCLLDSQPREALTAEQQTTLVDLAAMVVDELELRLAAHRIAQVDAALLEVTQGVSAVTGTAFFPALVQHLTKALGMSYACISLLVPEHPESLKTIAFCAEGQIVDNVAYCLQETPCLEALRQQKLCCYPQGVQALFPNDHFLAALGIASYAAMPFFDATGKPLGLLSVMDGKPLEQLQLVQSLLTLFAVRLTAELERQQSAEHLQLYANVVRNAQIGVVVWQLEDRNDPGSFRLLLANRAASEITGFAFEPLIGRTMGECFPMLLQSPLVQQYMEVVREGQARDLGEVSYGEDGIAAGIYSLKAFPLPDYCLGLAFENITARKRTEAQLQASQRYNQQIAAAMPGVLFVHDLMEQRNVYTNRQITDFLGYTSEQVQAMGADAIPTLIHPDDLERVEEYFESFRSAPEGMVLGIEYQARHANSEWRWLYSQSVVFNRTAAGLARQILGVSIDITARKQAEAALRHSEEHFRTLADNISQLAWMADETGWIFWYNRRWFDYTGTTLEAMQGWGWQQVHHPEHVDRVVEHFRCCLETGEPWEDTFPLRDKDGTYRWFLSRAIPIRDEQGQTLRWFGTNTDITERKQAETERQQLLECEQAARAEAERANRIKDEFLAVLSHELRSPLNPILGWTRLLQNGNLDAARQREALATIERNAKLQTQLIDDLLDISRIMQGKLSLTVTPVSLTFVMTAAVETVRLAAEAKNIQILLDLPTAIASVSGDAARLQQVVWNLLTNAVKFTPSGGQVTIALRQLDHLAQIRVTDTGKGIDPQFLPHVFEYFRQADVTTTRKFGGLGLGLAIVRQIVAMHGGTVWAESEGENRGAIFTVQLPLNLQAPSSEPESPRDSFATETPLSNLQILLVEDDTDTREFQAFLLEQYGARVTAVASGIAALQALERWRPDVLVSDIGMADMDGYRLIEQIRSRPPTQGGLVPAIALTAYAAELDQKRALQAGFQQHLTKPLEPERLVSAIVSLLQPN